MKNRTTRSIMLLLAVLVAVLAACGSDRPAPCHSIADLERLPEAGFLSPESERVRYETGQGNQTRESPYSVMVSSVLGSALDTAAVIRTYDAYFRPRQWVRRNIATDRITWEKADLNIEFLGGSPEEFVSPEIRAQEPYRTWYRLTIAEPGNSRRNPCVQPER